MIIRKIFHKFQSTGLYVICILLLCLAGQNTSAQTNNWMARVARIELDSMFIKEYRAAIEEHTPAALKEPGVLMLYAMFEKDRPNQVTVVEIYEDKKAYEFHIQTPHFLKYKSVTQKMVKSLKLVDMDPAAFGAKPSLLRQK
jgi:quinol monooxygenase YgiN